MAELMYNKAMFANKVLDDASASERLARVIMNIGTSLLSQNAFDSAIKWLRRSLEVLSGVNPLHISDAGTELRYSVMYNLVTGCLHNEAEEDLQYARNALETMLEVGFSSLRFLHFVKHVNNWPCRNGPRDLLYTD